MIARFGSCVLTVLLFTVHAGAAPTITKVDPPNWWVPHTLNPIQVLLTGDDLKGATVTTASKGFKIETRYASDNGHYLFAYVDIDKQVQPGTYHFQVRNASGTGEFELRLDRPLEARGRFQGFGPDDVIYLLMPDRFANGDPSNDPPPQTNVSTNQNAGGGGGRRGGGRGGPGYHGGDLRGVRDHLDYLKDLGVTGVWMTPVYRNSASNSGGAYHGYSTVDYYDVEPHFGTMKEFKELVDAAHKIGIKVVQDQVANHCGPRHPWNADPPTKTWFNNMDATPKPRNNYDIASLSDPYARPSRRAVPVRAWFAGSLPDLNQDDPLVSDYEIQNAVWWIGMTGIDGVRQDTYPYVDRSFWEQWQTAINREFPDFVCVSEITADTPAVLSFFEGGIRRDGIDTKLRAELDFPLEHTTQRVFGNNGPMTDLVNILAQDSLYLHPEMLVTFVGNHDQPRMLTVAGGDISKLLLAQTFTLTTRRTVHMYYGDEIALGAGPGTGDAAARANFPGGFPGDEVNAFKPEGRTGDAATVFNWTRGLLHFRQDHPALRRGDMVNLLVARDQYAYLRSSPEEYVLVLLNRTGNTNSVVLAVDDIALPEGLRFTSFPEGSADLAVTAGKLVISEPKEVEIYQADRTRSQK
jgi:glycosidase